MGTANPQTTSSNKGADVGIICKLTSTNAKTKAIIAPESFEAHA